MSTMTPQQELDISFLQAALDSDPQALLDALDAGANIYATNFANGWDAMDYAIARGSLETIGALAEEGYQLNGAMKQRDSTPLNFAVRSKPINHDVVKELIKLGADINGDDGNGFDPLCTCLKENSKEGITLLMELGADPARAQKMLAEYRCGGRVKDHVEMEALLQLKREGEACSQIAAQGTSTSITPLKALRLRQPST